MHFARIVLTGDSMRLPDRVLEPGERISEILFGLIMALTVTGTTSVVTADRFQIRTMLIAALGCNVAWGIIDAGMYLMARLIERGSNSRLLREIREAPDNQTALQVRVELQADCLAGVWANRGHAKWDFIEPGDVDSALQTASAIGDDRLQRQSQGYVVPDAFTHGTSAQRSRWFTTGLKSGDVASCDTFRNEQL